MIRQKMLRRDIKTSITDSIIKKYSLNNKQNLEKIIKRARAKYEKLQDTVKKQPYRNQKIREKMYAWLAMRGYSGDEIKTILKRIK